MSAVIANTDKPSTQQYPWYRYAWPWFLIAIPLVSVVLGSVMLYLAFNANNSLVVDDYYKEGKAYNLRIERDRLASLLGLQARITHNREGMFLELTQNTPDAMPDALSEDARLAGIAFSFPESLVMRWVHVTQADNDGVAELRHIGASRYVAVNEMFPVTGKFRLHIEPATAQSVLSDWRLVSDLVGFEQGSVIDVPAPELSRVFTSDKLQ